MTTIIFYLGLFCLVFSYIECDDLDYCYAKDPNPSKFFSTWTSPSTTWVHSETKEAGCKPIYVWGLFKHGVKKITDQQIKNSEDLWKVKMDIEKNDEEGRRPLCWEDYQNIHSSSAKYSVSKENNADLVEEALGTHDLFGFHLRGVMESSPSFSFSNRDIKILTSEAKEAKESAKKFSNSFFRSSTSVDGVIKEDKAFLRTKKSCANWNPNKKEADDFLSSPIFQSLRHEVSYRLGFTYGLPTETIIAMYESCVFWNILTRIYTPAFCSAFTPTHLNIMEYWQDLKHYYEFGYGNKLSEKMGHPFVNDMIDKLVQASNSKWEQNDGTSTSTEWIGSRINLYYADEENLMSLITNMGLYRDEEVPKHDNYHLKKNKRKWRSSLLSPIGASVHAVLYNCNNEEKMVEFYHNHDLFTFNACKDAPNNKCPLDTFLAEVKKNRKKYDHDEDYCGSFSQSAGSNSRAIGSFSHVGVVVIVLYILKSSFGHTFK